MTGLGAVSNKAWVRANPVVTFYLLAFGISWIGFLPVLAGGAGVAFFASPLWKAVLVLPACGPALAAAWTRRLAGEGRGSVERLREAIRDPLSRRWWMTAALLPGALVIAAQGFSSLLFRAHEATTPRASAGGFFWIVLVALAANPWEEVGWRGFALPKLAERYNPARAAVITGAMWALWHIPLFFLAGGWAGSGMASIPFVPWMAGIVGESCVLVWVYNSAGQSLKAAVIFHVAFNIWAGLIGVSSYAALGIVNGFAGVGLVWSYGNGLRTGSGRQ